MRSVLSPVLSSTVADVSNRAPPRVFTPGSQRRLTPHRGLGPEVPLLGRLEVSPAHGPFIERTARPRLLPDSTPSPAPQEIESFGREDARPAYGPLTRSRVRAPDWETLLGAPAACRLPMCSRQRTPRRGSHFVVGTAQQCVIEVRQQAVKPGRVRALVGERRRVPRHVSEEHVWEQLVVYGQVLLQNRRKPGVPIHQPVDELGLGTRNLGHRGQATRSGVIPERWPSRAWGLVTRVGEDQCHADECDAAPSSKIRRQRRRRPATPASPGGASPRR